MLYGSSRALGELLVLLSLHQLAESKPRTLDRVLQGGRSVGELHRLSGPM